MGGIFMKRKQLLATLLTVILATSFLGGCGKRSSDTSSSALTESTTQTTAESTTQTTPDTTSGTDSNSSEPELLRGNIYTSGEQILKEKKTYNVAVVKDPNSQNGFNDKQCVQEANAVTNVDMQYEDIMSDNWKEKVNIMLASGDLPDVFCAGNVDIMSNLECFVPLEDYIYKYCPHIVEMLEGDPSIKAAITAPDGHIYSLPTNKANPSNRVDNMIWMNPDWLKQLGLEVPTTTDEFVNVLRAFKANDCNGNGKADEIPFQARQSTDYAHNLSAILGAFGVVLPSDYVYSVDGNNVVFGGTEDGLFDGLNWLHDLYAEGLLDKDTFTMTNDEQNAKAQNEDVLMGSLIYWIPDSMDTKYKDYIVLDPLKGPNGDQLWYGGKNPLGANITGFCVTTACEDPEAMVRYYDYCMKDETTILEWQWGPEGAGLFKYVDDQGHWTQTEEFVPEGTNLTYFKRTVCGSVNSPNFLWSKYAALEVADERNAKKREAADRILPYCVTMMPNGLWETEPSARKAMLYTDIDSYMQKFIATSVVDGLNEEQWQEHLSNCEKLKVEEYRQLWQDYFDSKKK